MLGTDYPVMQHHMPEGILNCNNYILCLCFPYFTENLDIINETIELVIVLFLLLLLVIIIFFYTKIL